MHVVLSGYYGFDNVGDEAILYSIILSLRKINPEIKITVLSNNPEATRQSYNVNAVNRSNLFEINRAIKQADGLISGGGSLLQDATGIKSIPYYSMIMQIAKWHKKPVFIYAQGMGPINRPFSKWIVRKTLNKVDRITLRDQASQNLLKEIGVIQDSIIVPDPVLGLDASNLRNNQLKDDAPYIAVSVRDWSTNMQYKVKIAKTLDQLVMKGYFIIFVPMHGKHDEKASEETAALMNERNIIYPSNATIEDKIAVIGEAELLIGMRLHALVFSAITYTPFVALSYDPKIDAFASIFKQPLVGHVERDDWDNKTMLSVVLQILSQLSLESTIIRDKARLNKEIALETAYLALQTLSEISITEGDEKLCQTKKYYS